MPHFAIIKSYLSSEQIEINRFSHFLVAIGIRMQPIILKQKIRVQAIRLLRVSSSSIEVDDSVIFTRCANPLVHHLTPFLTRFIIIIVSLKWHDGASINLDAFLVSQTNHFLEGLNQLLGRFFTIP